MSLYFKPVIPRTADRAWQHAQRRMQEGQPRKLVAITSPLPVESAEMQTLKNIIAACKVQDHEFEIIQGTGEELPPWYAIRETCGPDVMLLFGIQATDLGVTAYIPLQAVTIFQETRWICTLSLEELNQRKDVRQSLWTEALKPIFVPA